MQDEKKQGERGGEMAIAHSGVIISDLWFFIYIYLCTLFDIWKIFFLTTETLY